MLHGQFHPRPEFRLEAASAKSSPSAAGNILGRWLHFGIAVCVISSLLLAGFTRNLHAGGSTLAGNVTFNLHKFIGLNALLLVSLFLMWSAIGHARQWADLFPWLCVNRLRTIRTELANPGTYHRMKAVPTMVQGCGIAVALTASASGLALVMLGMAPQAGAPSTMRFLVQLHLLANTALWAYLGMHLAAVVFHVASGRSGEVRRMFNLLQPEVGGAANTEAQK